MVHVRSERIGQGRENARLWFKEHPEAYDKVRRQVLEQAGLWKGGKNEAINAPAGAKEAAKDMLASASAPAKAEAKAEAKHEAKHESKAPLASSKGDHKSAPAKKH